MNRLVGLSFTKTRIGTPSINVSSRLPIARNKSFDSESSVGKPNDSFNWYSEKRMPTKFADSMRPRNTKNNPFWGLQVP